MGFALTEQKTPEWFLPFVAKESKYKTNKQTKITQKNSICLTDLDRSEENTGLIFLKKTLI